MLSTRLIQMIQDHADELMVGLISRLKTDPRTQAYRRFTDAEIRSRAYTVYKNLGTWMAEEPGARIREHYEKLGSERFQEGTPLHQVIYALVLTKNHLLDYVRGSGLAGTALEIYAEQELSKKVNQFFDHAIYYTAVGYANTGGRQKAAAKAQRR